VRNVLRENGFRKYLGRCKLNAKDISSSVKAVKDYEEHLKAKKSTLESAGLDALREYISLLIKEGRNSEDRLVAIARYYYYTKKKDLDIYFTSILGATNMLPDIGNRIATVASEETRRRVYQRIEFPLLGAPQEDYPKLPKQS
jgi:hypothetical protein